MKDSTKANWVFFGLGLFLMLILCAFAASFRIGNLENQVKQLEQDKEMLKEELINCYRRQN